MNRFFWRFREATLLIIVFLVAGLGFVSVTAAGQLQDRLDPNTALLGALYPVIGIAAPFVAIHAVLSLKKISTEQFILPITAMLFSIGITMIWRLRGAEGVWQQLVRGLYPGSILVVMFLLKPFLLEKLRQWAPWIGLGGLFLLLLTGVIGVQDETGARLALKFGPLPSIQTSELIKLSLIIFLSWYIEREGSAAEGRAHSVLWFRLPGVRYLAPAAAFVGAATLALVAMSDYGAVIILGMLFIVMLYTGFESRTFLTIAALGLGLSLLVGLVLSQVWSIPASIQYRYLAFQNPWSNQMMANGYTISEGPGYQIQQAVYAVIAGGATGAGLGMGSPYFIPLAHSDFILAALMEEMGSAVGIAIIFLYAFLVLRIIRVAILLPHSQVFERLLATGIGVHLFTQAFIMAGGTLNLFPLTGVTLPFLSQGGVAVLVNIFEIGLVLTLVQRIDPVLTQGKA